MVPYGTDRRFARGAPPHPRFPRAFHIEGVCLVGTLCSHLSKYNKQGHTMAPSPVAAPHGRRSATAAPRPPSRPPPPPPSPPPSPLRSLPPPPPPPPWPTAAAALAWILTRRQRSPALPSRARAPSGRARARFLPLCSRPFTFAATQSPSAAPALLRAGSRTVGIMASSHLRCSRMAGWGCDFEFTYRKLGWRLKSRKIESGLLPEFQDSLRAPL